MEDDIEALGKLTEVNAKNILALVSLVADMREAIKTQHECIKHLKGVAKGLQERLDRAEEVIYGGDILPFYPN